MYAEDSFGGFLPQAGTATIVRWAGAPARVDHALESGQVVSTAYDPMLGKVIAHGPDRESARRALLDALDETGVLGLTTNAGFLRALVASDEFRDATIDTAWLDTAEVPQARRRAAAPPRRLDLRDARRRPTPATRSRPTASGSAHRRRRPWCSSTARSSWTGPAAPSTGCRSGRSARSSTCSRRVVDGHRVRALVNVQPHIVEVSYQGQRHVFTRPDVFADQGAAVGDGTITAPMPGTVLDVRVEPGQVVEEGQVLGVLEAMKMELALKAPFAGTVTDVGAKAGAADPAGRDAVRGGGSSSEAAREGHDLRGRRARRAPEREGAGADRRQGGVRTPPGRRRPPDRRGHQLRAPEVGAAAGRRRRADDPADRPAGRGRARPPGAGAQRARPRPGARARPEAHRDLRLGHRDVRAEEPQPQPRRAVRDVRADRHPRPRRRPRRPRVRLDVLRRPVGGRGAGRAGGRRRQAALRPGGQPAQPRRHHRRRHRRSRHHADRGVRRPPA